MVPDIKSSLEGLKQSITNLKTLSEEFNSILAEEKVPRSGLKTALDQAFIWAAEAEKNIVSVLRNMGAGDLDPGDNSLDQYDTMYSGIIAKINTARVKADLERFSLVFSNELRYDDALKEYREKAALLTASLKAGDPAQEEIEPYLAFVEILENQPIGGNDPLYDKIENFSGAVFRGLTQGKYTIKKNLLPDSDSNFESTAHDTRESSPPPSVPEPQHTVEAPTVALAGGNDVIHILSDNEAKITPETFRKHLENISGSPASVLMAATWLIYFTADDMLRLFSLLRDKDVSREEIKNGLRDLAGKGYLSIFKIGEDKTMRYTLRNNVRAAFSNPVIRKTLDAAGSDISKPAMKGYYPVQLSLLKLEDLYLVEKRNEALLDAAGYIRDNNGSEAVHKKIIEPLHCNIYLFFTGDTNLAFVSAAMLKEPRGPEKEQEFVSYFNKNPGMTLVVSGDAAGAGISSTLSSMGIKNKWISLEDYSKNITDYGTTRGTDPSAESEIPAVVEKMVKTETEEAEAADGIPSPDTIECLASILVGMDTVKEEDRFYDNCSALVQKLIQAPAALDKDTPDRIVQAVVFLKALSLGSFPKDKKDDFAARGRVLQLASGLRLDDLSYDSDTLGNAFPDDSEPELKIPAWLRAMFAPDRKKDFGLYTMGRTSIEDNNVDYLGSHAPAIKKILQELAKLGTTEDGFSRRILNLFADQTNKQDKAKKLAEKAGDLQHPPHINARFAGKVQLIECCFGEKSDLFQAMDIIKKNEKKERDHVQLMVGELDDVDAYIDKKWKLVKNSHNNTAPFKRIANIARDQVRGFMQKQRKLMDEWFDFTADEDVVLVPEIKEIREELLLYLPEAIKSIKDENAGGDAPLLGILEEINTSLKTGIPENPNLRFTEFLHSCWVDLDDQFYPVLEYPSPVPGTDAGKESGYLFNSLTGAESWRSAARHIAEEKYYSLEDMLDRIKDGKNKYCYENIGYYTLIEKYLSEYRGIKQGEKYPWEKDSGNRNKDIESAEADLDSEIELAFAYGRIEESEIGRLQEIKKKFREYFLESQNFGRFRFALDLFREEMEIQKGIIKARMESWLERSLAKSGRTCPLAKEIRSLLDKADFSLSEEYLIRLDSKETELPKEEKFDEKDYFGDLIDRWDTLYRLCDNPKHRGAALRSWGPEHFPRNPSWSPRQVESSHRLLQNWPNIPQDVTEAQIRGFFQEIGFTVESGRMIRQSPHPFFELNIQRPDLNQRSYRHPIADFGTRMDQPVYAICLFGRHAVISLKNIISEQGENHKFFVLYNNFSTLQDRRSLADTLHRMEKQHSFLFIDQILALYLAGLDQGERMTALLKCALPYAFCRPFVNGAGSISDEMFFGRSFELDDILNMQGTNIVYGGRQLGKTALLERAKSIFHRPPMKEFAAYRDVKDKTAEDILGDVADELKRAGLPIQAKFITTWEDLCKKLRNLFDKGDINRLLLLIDEADKFLEFDEAENFTVLGQLLNFERQTKHRFKFVLAGLHNVARSKKAIEKNGIFPQMPKPLCIKPLSPKDARNLLSRPLSYLGFNTEHLRHLELILANTNYYPGILHFFGYILINTALRERYSEFYNEKENPPYDLSDDQLRKIFSDRELNKAIKEKINITLNLDPRYEVLASIIAAMYYEGDNNQTDMGSGYTAEEILNYAGKNGISYTMGGETAYLVDLSPDQIKTLLSELVDMRILWTDEEESFFKFRRNSFLGTIGTEESVLAFLMGEGPRN
jgi:hypothetical protein